MSGGREAGEDALLGKEEGAGADGEESTLARGVLLLEFGKGSDQGEGFGARLKDGSGSSTDDDEDVEVVEAVVSLLEGDLGADDNTLLRDDLGLGGRDGAFECPGGCMTCARLAIAIPVCRSCCSVCGVVKKRGRDSFRVRGSEGREVTGTEVNSQASLGSCLAV